MTARGDGDAVGRTTFDTSRVNDFLEPKALQSQTGRMVSQFGDVVIKELVDNALDAAETAGRPPVIEVGTEVVGDTLRVSVSDNGDGMPADVITRILNFAVTVSDKAAYRSPTRGLQGNAFKTIFGIAHVGAGQPVVIEACGIRHEITVAPDPVEDVKITHTRTDSTRTTGTAVTIALPIMWKVDVEAWLQSFAMINPHATFILHGVRGDTDGAVFYKATVGDRWRKPRPTDKLVPAWYDAAALQRLIFAHIRAARRGGRDVPLGSFIRGFDGMTSTAKAKAVAASVPHTRLSGFEKDHAAMGTLLDAMQREAKTPTPTVLGKVPAEHYRARLDELFGVVRFWHRRGSAIVDGVPWVIEVAVAETVKPGRVIYAANYSVTFGDLLGGTTFRTDDVHAYGAENLLHESDAAPGWDNADQRAAVVHVITPAPEFLDKGKVRLTVPGAVAQVCADTLAGAGRALRKEKEKREQDARAEEKRQEQARRKEERRAAAEARNEEYKPVTIRDAVFEVIPEAIEHRTFIDQRTGQPLLQARSLYYGVRERVEQRYGLEITQSYFRKLTTDWQREHGPIPGLYYDPRGKLDEPHTGKSVDVGTREVAGYTFPDHVFDKILYVEKKGALVAFEALQLKERYDLAILSGEGQPAEAARELFARAEAGDYTLFVLHDADPYGYSIARTIAEETDRMPDHHVKVIDLGLMVGQAIDRGLMSEGFTRKQALPEWMPARLTEDELEWFTGEVKARKHGKPSQWACRRVELNAMTDPELVAFVEEGLVRHGATGKVIPPAERIEKYAAGCLEAELIEKIDRRIATLISAPRIARKIVAEFRGDGLATVDRDTDVVQWLERHRAKSWRGATNGKVVANVREKADRIDPRIDALITEAWGDGIATNEGEDQ